MRRWTWVSLVMVAGLGGCLPSDFVMPSGDKSAAKPVEPQRRTVAPPVTAGQINGNNAQEKAAALREELNRDMERTIDPPDGKDKK